MACGEDSYLDMGNRRDTSERKSRTQSYDDLVDLLMELAMERENDS